MPIQDENDGCSRAMTSPRPRPSPRSSSLPGWGAQCWRPPGRREKGRQFQNRFRGGIISAAAALSIAIVMVNGGGVEAAQSATTTEGKLHYSAMSWPPACNICKETMIEWSCRYDFDKAIYIDKVPVFKMRIKDEEMYLSKNTAFKQTGQADFTHGRNRKRGVQLRVT